MTRIYQLLAIMLLACSISACSGGGGGGGGSSGASTSSGGTSNSSATSPATAAVHTLQLAWSVPTSRENGAALTSADLNGYQVYYFREGGSADNGEVVFVAGGSSTNAQIAVNGSGTYYFAITAVDQAGLTSQLSNYVAVALN